MGQGEGRHHAVLTRSATSRTPWPRGAKRGDSEMIKAPPFPKRAKAADAGAEIDALLPAASRPMPDFVLSDEYAHTLASERMRRYRRIDGDEQERERECAACADYYFRLAASGTIDAETARRWTAATVRFNVALTLISGDMKCQEKNTTRQTPPPPSI